MKIVIENKAGSYKEFVDDADDGTYKYPLKGVSFPTDYGYIEGYTGEDTTDLDVFVGKGNLFGSFTVWRYDVPLETKFVMNVTEQEWQNILLEYKPVLKNYILYKNQQECNEALEKFKS